MIKGRRYCSCIVVEEQETLTQLLWSNCIMEIAEEFFTYLRTKGFFSCLSSSPIFLLRSQIAENARI